MYVTVLGSGDAFGSGARFQTRIALADHPAAAPHTLIDCGATSMLALRHHGVDPHGIDTVLISHLHGDHFAGLPFLILDGQFRRRTRDLAIVGPPGTQPRLTSDDGAAVGRPSRQLDRAVDRACHRPGRRAPEFRRRTLPRSQPQSR